MKRNIVLLLGFLLCLNVAACGSKETGSSTDHTAMEETVNGKEAAEENVAEENTIEKSGEEQSTPAEDEYVLAGDEQFRITDTADISMKEQCNNYAYPFDIVIPVVEGCELREADDMKFYEIFNPNMSDYYSIGFVTEKRSGGRMFTNGTGVDGEIFANGQDMAERNVPTNVAPSVYCQYNSLDNGDYTLSYEINLYSKKTVAEATFYIRNSEEASEADEVLFRLNLKIRKKVGVDRSAYMMDYIEQLKEGIFEGMGLDLDLDQETMTELHREALEEKTDGTGANVSLVPQIREAGDESSDPRYEEVIGDVDVDTGAVTVSDMTELVAGLDFKIDESVYDYKSLGLDGLTILAPGGQYITGYTDSGIEAAFDNFMITVKCQTTNVALPPSTDDVILADTDGYTVYRMTDFDDNSNKRSYQRYLIYDKENGAGLNIHLEVTKYDSSAADRFISDYLPAFETTLAGNF
ncbi:hypothetical protein [Suilimivivens sp.]|uniref:hypothetical protein n=1 Tax=Suilimivivens sp. TaxID=2981669 RepID=UPI00307B6953